MASVIFHRGDLVKVNRAWGMVYLYRDREYFTHYMNTPNTVRQALPFNDICIILEVAYNHERENPVADTIKVFSAETKFVGWTATGFFHLIQGFNERVAVPVPSLA